MPSSTPKQANFMRAVAHGFKPTQEKGPPVKVAKEFEADDEKKAKKKPYSEAKTKAMASHMRKPTDSSGAEGAQSDDSGVY